MLLSLGNVWCRSCKMYVIKCCLRASKYFRRYNIRNKTNKKASSRQLAFISVVTPRSIRIHRNKSCQGTLTCDQRYPEYLIWWQKTSIVLSYNRLRCVRKFTNITSHLASLPSLISMSSLSTQDLPITVHHLEREGRGKPNWRSRQPYETVLEHELLKSSISSQPFCEGVVVFSYHSFVSYCFAIFPFSDWVKIF